MPGSDPPRDPLLGTHVGYRYEITGIVGEGGMGVVYRGIHEELQRPVAIKVLGPAWSTDRNAVERFFREARTASSLGHPNIVEVHDLGRLPDTRPYLVMPLLEGRDLAQLLEDEGPLDPDRVAKLLTGVANALDLIHAKGLVHRDIKPENLLVSVREDGEETVKILDFGLAALALSTGSSRLTQQGIVCGTPTYMPPESSHGEIPDGRGDLYSLAVVVFELLTGAPPFQHERPLDLLRLKMTNDPPRLAELGAREFSPEVERVIARGLAREPADRYATVGAFVQALRHAAAAKPAAAPSRSGSTEMISWTPPPPLEEPADPNPPRTRSPTPLPLAEEGAGLGARSRRVPWVIIVAVLLVTTAVGWHLWSSASVPASAPVSAPVSAPASVPASAPVSAPVPASAPAPALVDVPASSSEDEVSTRSKRRAENIARDATKTAQPSEPRPTLPEPNRARAQELTTAGTQAMIQGLLPRAISLFRDATLAAPTFAPAWRGLGLANERMNRRSEAVMAYRRYLALADSAPDAARIEARVTALGK